MGGGDNFVTFQLLSTVLDGLSMYLMNMTTSPPRTPATGTLQAARAKVPSVGGTEAGSFGEYFCRAEELLGNFAAATRLPVRLIVAGLPPAYRKILQFLCGESQGGARLPDVRGFAAREDFRHCDGLRVRIDSIFQQALRQAYRPDSGMLPDAHQGTDGYSAFLVPVQ